MSRRWRPALAAAAAACLVACTPSRGSIDPVASPAGGPSRHVEIVYLAPSPEGDPAHLSAFRGAEVALQVAGLAGVDATITWVEVPEAPDGWEAPEADAAIIAPGTPRALVAVLGPLLEIPTVSLADGVGAPAWRRLVAGDAAIASEMLRIGGIAPCRVTAPGAPRPADRGGDAARAPARLRAGALLRDPAGAARCSAILWTGDGASGAALRMALVGAGLERIAFVATEGLRDGRYEELAGEGGRGTLVVSGAADVTTRVDVRTRRFVQDFQAWAGLPPGPFAAEGWDAAELLLLSLREGWPATFTGVVRRYDLDGPDAPPVMIYRLAGTGWRPVSRP